MERCRGRGWPHLLRGLWVWKEGCHRREYANVLLAAKGPCVSSALQVLQIATSSVAEAVWCTARVIMDGKAEWSGVQRSRIASFGSRRVVASYGRRVALVVLSALSHANAVRE